MLRKGFDETMKDPEFHAEAHKVNFEVNPVLGEAMQRTVAKILATPKAAATTVIIRKRLVSCEVKTKTHDNGKTVTMWKSARLASGANVPTTTFFPSARNVVRTGRGSR